MHVPLLQVEYASVVSQLAATAQAFLEQQQRRRLQRLAAAAEEGPAAAAAAAGGEGSGGQGLMNYDEEVGLIQGLFADYGQFLPAVLVL